MSRPICPECVQGKHQNCDRTAWDDDADRLVPCGCEHSEAQPRKSLWERFDDARSDESTGDLLNSHLTEAAWSWFEDRLSDQDVIDAFREAWIRADAEGATGSRVARGLQAVAEAVTKP